MDKNYDVESIIKKAQELAYTNFEKEALALCSKDEYLDNEDIQAERLFILVKRTHEIEKAYEIWKKFENSENVNIVARGIEILMKHKDNGEEKALEYANKHISDDIKYIHVRVKLLIKLKKYDEVFELCDRYPEDQMLIRLKENAKKRIEKPFDDKIAIFLTKIYADDITLEEIKNSNIDSYEKSILLLAYYEKHNPNAGIKMLKKIRKIDNLSADYKKSYNAIFGRLTSNKYKYFDVLFYADILKRSVDYEMALQIIKKKEEEKEKVVKVIDNKEETYVVDFKPKKNKKDNNEKNYVEVVGNRVNNRYHNNINKGINKDNKQERVLLIKDVLEKELNDLGTYLYVMMQNPDTRKNAIRAWDNLENMINKSATDKETLVKVANILLKITSTHPEILVADDNKLKKLIIK